MRGHLTTPAKNSYTFCPTPAHHTSVLHVLVHEMQLEAFLGNREFFLKCNYRGNRGRTWENSGELRRSAGICGELWGAYSALWELLASRRLRMKLKENAWTCNIPVSDFRIVLFCGRCCPMASHWNQMDSNDDDDHDDDDDDDDDMVRY